MNSRQREFACGALKQKQMQQLLMKNLKQKIKNEKIFGEEKKSTIQKQK